MQFWFVNTMKKGRRLSKYWNEIELIVTLFYSSRMSHYTSNIIKLNLKWAQKLIWTAYRFEDSRILHFFANEHFLIQTFKVRHDNLDLTPVCSMRHAKIWWVFYMLQMTLNFATVLLYCTRSFVTYLCSEKNWIFLFIYQSNMIVYVLENLYHLSAWNQMQIIGLFVITKNNQANNVHLLSQFLIIDENVLP